MISDTVSNQPPSQTIQVIGVGRRLVAVIIDYIILFLILSVVTVGISFIAILVVDVAASTKTLINLLTQCLRLLIVGTYFVIFWVANGGQTLGKMAMGIKVVMIDGSSITTGKAILRFIGYIAGGFIMWVGFIWAAFDEKRQGWHDKMAKTYVVSKDTQFSTTDTITIVPSDSTKAAAIIVSLLFIGPTIIVFLIFLLLLIFASTSGVSPFIYSLF